MGEYAQSTDPKRGVLAALFRLDKSSAAESVARKIANAKVAENIDNFVVLRGPVGSRQNEILVLVPVTQGEFAIDHQAFLALISELHHGHRYIDYPLKNSLYEPKSAWNMRHDRNSWILVSKKGRR